jgi:DUSAM domain-containing protein
MEYLDADLHAVWHQIRELDNQIVRGETLELSERVRDLLLSAAPTVAIGRKDAEVALSNVASATALLRRIRERIRDGSNRIGDALFRMYDLQKAGDLEGARQQMRDVLAVEVVPHYREIAEGEIEKLDDLS